MNRFCLDIYKKYRQNKIFFTIHLFLTNSRMLLEYFIINFHKKFIIHIKAISFHIVFLKIMTLQIQYQNKIGYFAAIFLSFQFKKNQSLHFNNILALYYLLIQYKIDKQVHIMHKKQFDQAKFIIHFKKGLQQFINGDVKLSIQQFTKAQKLNPDDYETNFNLGLCFFKSENTEDMKLAIDQFNKAIQIYPQEFAPHYNLGLTFFSNGDFQSAIREYSKAAQLSPLDFSSHFNLGLSLFANNKIKQAIDQFTSAKQIAEQINQSRFEIYFNLGLCFYNIQDKKMVIKLFIKANELNEDNFQILYHLGLSLLQTDNAQYAIKYFRKAKKQLLQDFGLCLNLGKALIETNKFKQAIIQLLIANKIKQSNLNVWYQLGIAYILDRNFYQASYYNEKVLKINPQKGLVLFNKGYMLLLQKKINQAIYHFDEYLKKFPNSPQLYVGLGLIVKMYPYLRQKCDILLQPYRLNKMDMGIAFSISCFYQIIDKDKKAEIYLIKAFRIYNDLTNTRYESEESSLQSHKISGVSEVGEKFMKYFLKTSRLHEKYLKLLIPNLVNKLIILKGVFAKYIKNQKLSTQNFSLIFKIYEDKQIPPSSILINIFQQQFKFYTPEAQTIFIDFLLCEMSYVNLGETIQNYIYLYNIYQEALKEISFWNEIQQSRKKQIVIIGKTTSIVEQFIRKNKKMKQNKGSKDIFARSVKIIEGETELISSLDIITIILEDVVKYKDSLQRKENLGQIIIAICKSLKNLLSHKIAWRNNPSPSDCFYKIYSQIQNTSASIDEKYKLLQEAIETKKYHNLSEVIEQINVWLATAYSINELIKSIYNRISYHLFKNENGPRELNILLTNMLEQQNFDFLYIKQKLEAILQIGIYDDESEKSKKSIDYFTSNVLKWMQCHSQMSKIQQKQFKQNRLNDFQQKTHMPNQLKRKYSGEIKNTKNQIKTLIKSFQIFQPTAEYQQYYQQYSPELSKQDLDHQKQIFTQFKFKIDDIEGFQIIDKKCYQNFHSLLFQNVYLLYKYVAEKSEQTKYIFSKLSNKGNFSCQIKSEVNSQLSQVIYRQIPLFQYFVPKEDILTKYYSIQGDQRYIRILWGLTREHLFSFISCVAGSIDQLNQYGINHKNISFTNLKKVGKSFKLVGLEQAFFISLQYGQNKQYTHNKDKHIIKAVKEKEIQQQLVLSFHKILDYFLNFDFNKGKQQIQWFDDNDKSWTNKEISFNRPPQIDDIPKFMFGEVNSIFVKQFVQIKFNGKYEQFKQNKCIKFLKKQSNKMHLRQFKRLIKNLLQNQFIQEKQKAQKITREQRTLIFNLFYQLYKDKITCTNFIDDLDNIEKGILQFDLNKEYCWSDSEESQINKSSFRLQQSLEDQKIKTLLKLDQNQFFSKKIFNLPKLQQLVLINCQLLANSSLTHLKHFIYCEFDKYNKQIVGLFPDHYVEVKSLDDIKNHSSNKAIYWFIMSLANFIEELQSIGIYCCCLNFNSILIQQREMFKFIDIQDKYQIEKTKSTDLEECKIEQKLIQNTNNILRYLLDCIKTQDQETILIDLESQIASVELQRIIGDLSNASIIKIIKKDSLVCDINKIRIYFKKIMRKNHLIQFNKLVNDLLREERISYSSQKEQELITEMRKVQIRKSLFQLMEQNKVNDYISISYRKIKNIIGIYLQQNQNKIYFQDTNL